MKRSIMFATLTGCVGASVASAQPLNLAESGSLNRFGASFRPGFNIEANFTGLGGFARRTEPGPNDTSASVDRNYDDGYNRVDVSGNVGRLTGYWGYDHGVGDLANQTPIDGDVVIMNSSASAAVGTSPNRGNDPQLGFEVTYNRRLGHLGKSAWGLELAFNWTDVDIHDRNNASAPVNRISDAYSVGGITPPLDAPPAPAYRGTFSGLGALISDVPERSIHVLPNGARITGERLLEASVYGWRVGPYLDVPVCSRVALSFSAGLAVAYVTSDFSFSENVTIPGVGTELHSGAGSRDEVLLGYYASGLISFAVCEQVNLFAGVQYQDVGNFWQTVGSQTAALDLGKSIFMTLGLSWSF